MTAAAKNSQAFGSLLGDGALAQQLGQYRIGVYCAANSDTAAGRVLAEALAEVLGRLWPNLDVAGPLEATFLQVAQEAAASGELAGRIVAAWAPPYAAVVSIGGVPPSGSGPYVQVGADDWTATVGEHAACGASANPVGPTAAAALAGAEVFKLVFADRLRDFGVMSVGELTWNLSTMDGALPPVVVGPLRFEEAYLFGLGAVTHGVVWLLERWPERVDGALRAVDHDKADSSNGQRYVGLRQQHWGRPKAEVTEERLRTRHPDLHCEAHIADLNSYFARAGTMPEIGLAIAGLDSEETRRHVALKLPRRAVNMWTARHHLGAARFGNGTTDEWPCLFCAYPEALTEGRAEFAVVASMTGIPAARVRELLDGDGVLNTIDATPLAHRLGCAPETVAGQPIRTVLQQLCATGRVAIQAGAKEVDVPFAFSSLLAGLLGFVEVVRELQNVRSAPYRWAYNVMKRPAPGQLQAASPRGTCFVCGDGSN